MILTDNDRAYLESCDEDGVTAVGRLLSRLDAIVEEGVAQGRFTREEAEADLEVALWRAFALLQCEDYISYARAVEVLQKAAAAAGASGVWHYRLAAALTHVGRLREAFDVAREGVEAEPGYPWGWLHYAKLLAHFGEPEAAQAAVKKGLELVPGDSEFLTLEKEIRAGASLTEMLFHYIKPEHDEDLQTNRMDLEEVMEKQQALLCVLKDPEGFKAACEAFAFVGLKPDAEVPYLLSAEMPLEGFGGARVPVTLRMNEAGLSHMPPVWIRHAREALTNLMKDKGVSPADVTFVAIDLDRSIHLFLTPDPKTGVPRAHHFKLNPAVGSLDEKTPTEPEEDLPPDVEQTLAIVDDLDAKGDYRGIIRLLEAEPDGVRHPALTHELARAYNNAAEMHGPELLRAIRLLESVRERYEDTHKWQFRMGYALFYLEREEEALPYFERAEAKLKGDQDSLEFMRLCRFQMAYPRFMKPLRERIGQFWETFAQKSAELLGRLADPDRCMEAVREIEEDLRKAVPDARVLLGERDGVEHLIFSAGGDWLRTYLLRAAVRRMPEALKPHWRVTLGRPRGPAHEHFIINGKELNAENVYLWEEKSEDGTDDRLIAYHEAFETLEEPEFADAFACVHALLDNAIGEAVRMKYYYNLRLTRKAESGVGFSVLEFPGYLRETDPMRLVTTMDDYLDEVNRYDWDGSDEKDCDYLIDATHGELSCPALVLAYFNNEPALMRILSQAGATAGALYLDTADHSPEERMKLRDALRAELREKVPESYESVGIVDGKRYAYDVFLAWDLPAVLNAASDFAESRDAVLELGFHSLWREAGGLTVKKPEED